jgi:hypothetical protein
MKNKLLKVCCGAALFALMTPLQSLADSISPDSYTATIGVGETTTIHKTVTITEEVTSAKVDVFFLTDTTGSMYGLIDSVKTAASGILSAASGFGDVAFGVGEYRDFGDYYGAYRLNTDITTDTTAVQAGINLYTAGGGGDWEEANLYALNEVATTTSWRDDSTRILVWFGDAPGHDPSGGITEAMATASLVAENITVEAMNTGSLDYYGQASRIAAATGGTYYASIDTGAIVAEINDAIASVFEDYSEVALDISGVPAGITASVVPGSYTGDFSRSSEATFEFDVDLTGDVAGTYSFDINALVDGGIVATESDRITVGAASVPEPSVLLLFGTCLAGLAGAGYRRKK